MDKTMHGVVHGNTIELSESLGMADGQPVEIVVKSIDQSKTWGEGLRRCAGALANEWSEEDDRILDAIHQERQSDTRQDVAE